MLRPPPVVPRDPARLARPVASVTGGHDCGETPCLHGLPEAIGTSEDFSLTHRPGEYLGQPRLCYERYVWRDGAQISGAEQLDRLGISREGRSICRQPIGHDGLHNEAPTTIADLGQPRPSREPRRELAAADAGLSPLIEQPAPLPSVGPDMQDLVVVDIDMRKRHGVARYGQALKAWDGRDNLRDAYEEALDLVIYLRKEIYRRDGQ